MVSTHTTGEELFLDCLDAMDAFLDAAGDFNDPAHLWHDDDNGGGSNAEAQEPLAEPLQHQVPGAPQAPAQSAQQAPDQAQQAGGVPVSTHSMRPSPRVHLWDKLAFVLGSTCLWVCSFWLGHSPSTIYRLYTALGCILFTARYIVYRARKWHYYLLDMCYACNALLMVHLWLAPRAAWLARITFSFNTGPLTTSILAFRNSLVYHDMDKVTSLFLHLVPACVSWALRHNPDTTKFGESSSGAAGFKDLVAVPLLCYCVWAVLYWMTIFVVAAERINRRGYTTLFTYVTTRKRGTFAAITQRVPPTLRPPVYLLLHCCFCGVSMLLALMAWRSWAFHTGLLVAVSTWAIYQGSVFYFEVFARSHVGHKPAQEPLGHHKAE